ncbi:MAG TPA: 16S rRNA (guanine(527)-N(7))-methyltransferase RsmG [Mycobacteriales bacterium]|nr:16S rRNA (guanine(527)-N(7))-methyltransferase RsmG [Mycobacteriales bacterium]
MDPAGLDRRAAVFGERLPLAERYAELLVTAGIERGLLGPREAARVWDRHLLNSAALADLVGRGASVIDLGSGAGLPGIPLTIARPDLSIVLLEPMARRVQFLTECIDSLHLGDQVAVCHDRARPGATAPADVVVARAVKPLAGLLELAEPLLRPGGELLALKGVSAAKEIAALPPRWRSRAEVLTLVGAAGPATVVRVTWHARQQREAMR